MHSTGAISAGSANESREIKAWPILAWREDTQPNSSIASRSARE